jgi:hypothetical protein
VIPTHAIYLNGDTWMELQVEGGLLDDFTRTLRRLDGTKLYSLLLWKLPPGKSLDETSATEEANEYLQCAGSADRMTCEVRRSNGGGYEHFVVGRAPNGNNRGGNETIHWDGVDTVVAPNEIFTADEAAELFVSFYRTGWVPSKYVLRPLST